MTATWNIDPSKTFPEGSYTEDVLQHFKHLISNILSTDDVADFVKLEIESDGYTLSEIQQQYLSECFNNVTHQESTRLDERMAASTRGLETRCPDTSTLPSSSQVSEPSSTVIFLMAGATFITFFAFLLGKFNGCISRPD